MSFWQQMIILAGTMIVILGVFLAIYAFYALKDYREPKKRNMEI
ncbi:MAG: hypothetical protein AB1595_01440 [bacterium]